MVNDVQEPAPPEANPGLEGDLRRLAKSSIELGALHPSQKKAKSRVAAALFGDDSSDNEGEDAAADDAELGRGLGPGHLDFDHIHRYQVQSLIGAGAMGRVYRAYDPQLARTLAIKVLHPDYSDEEKARARIVREAQALARLSHPNVIQVYDVGDSKAGFFIAMEWVLGKTLREHVRESPSSDWQRILHYFIDAGEGLAAAHQAGMVHRDFKPENVIVGESGRVRVLDFGLARPSGPLAHLEEHVESTTDGENESRNPVTMHRWMGLTQTGALIGTPIYMAPELYKGAPADARSDQFAYCVALFDALYRQRPFEGKNVESYAEAVSAGHLVVPDPGEIPLPVLAVIQRGLSTEPEDRFVDMRALLLALRKAVDTPKMLRRRRRVAWSAALLLFGGTAFFGISQNSPQWLAQAGAKLGFAGHLPALAVRDKNAAIFGDGSPRRDGLGAAGDTGNGQNAGQGEAGERADEKNRGDDGRVVGENPGALGSGKAAAGGDPRPANPPDPKTADPNKAATTGKVDGSDAANKKVGEIEAKKTEKRDPNSRAAPRRKQRAKSNKSTVRKSGWCSLHEDSYRLLRREKRRQSSFKARGGTCFVCRIEARASRTRQFSPGDCQGYQLCGPTDAAKCK